MGAIVAFSWNYGGRSFGDRPSFGVDLGLMHFGGIKIPDIPVQSNGSNPLIATWK
jgi:hypothetical protein